MANTYHDQLTGSDLHENKVNATTGTELTPASQAVYDARYVNTSGDTMTGALTLAADPASALQAATKQYVDTKATRLTKTIGPVSGFDYVTDGVADDVQIRQAISDLHAAGGGTLLFKT